MIIPCKRCLKEEKYIYKATKNPANLDIFLDKISDVQQFKVTRQKTLTNLHQMRDIDVNLTYRIAIFLWSRYSESIRIERQVKKQVQGPFFSLTKCYTGRCMSSAAPLPIHKSGNLVIHWNSMWNYMYVISYLYTSSFNHRQKPTVSLASLTSRRKPTVSIASLTSRGFPTRSFNTLLRIYYTCKLSMALHWGYPVSFVSNHSIASYKTHVLQTCFQNRH